jgi:hypothetical protein
MDQKRFVLCSATALLMAVAACSKSAETPLAPSATTDASSDAVPADGSRLKVTAPVPVSPTNNAQPDGALVLVASKAQGKFTSVSPSYEFEVKNAGGGVVYSRVTGGVGSGPNNVEHTVDGTLEFDTAHTWRVRAVQAGVPGPWSTAASFRTPSGGYIRDNEVFDPLTNGRTVGEIVGPVTFIPGVGVRLETYFSHIRYRLPRPLTVGEFSLIITNVATNTEGGKTKLFAMSEGLSDIVTNDRRFTVEKRGDPEGIVAWRMITHEDQIDTEGAEREFVSFNPGLPYLWSAIWNGRLTVRAQEGGGAGRTVYEKGKNYDGAYDPDPHYAFIGSPVGRSGPDAATVPGMVVRQVWISARPRPGGISQ